MSGKELVGNGVQEQESEVDCPLARVHDTPAGDCDSSNLLDTRASTDVWGFLKLTTNSIKHSKA